MSFVRLVSQRVIRRPVAPIRSFSLNPIKDTAETVTAIVESVEKSRQLVMSTTSSLKNYAMRAKSQVRKR